MIFGFCFYASVRENLSLIKQIRRVLRADFVHFVVNILFKNIKYKTS